MTGLNKSREPASPLVMTESFDSHCSADDVRAQVARIMVSEEFNRSPRLRRFLQFIVDESLSGRDDQIKAYSIGLSVCDRDEQFDPSIDPIVRIEAGRLRRALEHYYLTQGSSDAIAIDVPKGAYRPVITNRPVISAQPTPSPGLGPRALQRLSGDAAVSPATAASHETSSFLRRMMQDARPAWLVAALAVISFALAVTFMDKGSGRNESGIRIHAPNFGSELGLWRLPTLLVLPFHSDGSDSDQSSVADTVTDGVAQYLMQQSDVNVRRASNASAGAAASLYETPSIDFVVSGSVRKVDNHVRIFVQLTNVGTEASVWSQNYDRELHGGAIEPPDDIARSIMTQVARLSVRAAPVAR